MALRKKKYSVKSIQSDTIVAPVKSQEEVICEYAISQSNRLELKAASQKYNCKRESSDTSFVSTAQKIHLNSDEESTIYQNVCIGGLSPNVAECKMLLYEKKYPNYKVHNELKRPSCSLPGFSGGENNSMTLGYRPEQIHMHPADADSPLYSNAPIRDLARDRVTNKTLIYKNETPKLRVHSEWGKPNCSPSLSVHENNSTCLRNRARREEVYYSDEESSISENECI
ncbi:hypothetical protein NPIL_343121, partial [Nephila pilipes]